MFSINLKKKLAVLLTGAMVLGMTTTAFAAETSGSSDGAGTFEGHANSTIVSVILPTVSESSTAFNYIYDPEGLIEGTSHAAYPDASFTGSNVYFESAKDTYTGTSKTLTVSNNSMVSINVTVKVALEAGSNNDPALVSSNAIAAAKDPSLYLGLKVGDKPAQALLGEDVEVTVSLNGMPNNYSLSYNGTPHSYSYKVKEDASGWESVGFSVEGAANKVTNAKDKTAPTLKVTWKYETVGEVEEEGDPTSTPTETPAADKAPSIAVTDYTFTKGTDLVIETSFGSGDLKATKITKVKTGQNTTTFNDMNTDNYTINGDKVTISGTKNYAGVTVGQKRYVKVCFDEGSEIMLTLTIAQ